MSSTVGWTFYINHQWDQSLTVMVTGCGLWFPWSQVPSSQVCVKLTVEVNCDKSINSLHSAFPLLVRYWNNLQVLFPIFFLFDHWAVSIFFFYFLKYGTSFTHRTWYCICFLTSLSFSFVPDGWYSSKALPLMFRLHIQCFSRTWFCFLAIVPLF